LFAASRLQARPLPLYQALGFQTSLNDPEAAMRAEPQKLVDSIKEALVLLRRHL